VSLKFSLHNQYHNHENINQMLLNSLMGMEQDRLDKFNDFPLKA